MTSEPATPRLRGTLRSAAGIAVVTGRAAPSHLLVSLVLTLTAGVAPVAVTWLTKLAIDRLVSGPDAAPPGLAWVAAGLAGATVLAAVLPHGQQYLQGELGRRAGLALQERLFRALDRQVGLRRFEDPRFHDRLTLAQQACQSTPREAVVGVLGVVQSAATMGGFLGSLLAVSPLLAILVLLAGAPALAAELALSRRRARMLLGLSHTERREFFYASLLTDVNAATEIRLFGLGGFLRGRMLGELRKIHREHRGMDRRELRTQFWLALLSTGVSGAGLAWAVLAATSGRVSVGDVALLVGALAGVQNALTGAVQQGASAHHAMLQFQHWAGIVRLPPDLPVTPSPRRVRALARGIELRDVWFRYRDDHAWVLQGVDLMIPRGQSLALVGRNGTGKSTIVKLLCRFYDPARGAILWDGVDLRELGPAALRDRIGAVFQDYMAYDLTATENIAVGDLSALANRERVEAAARFAGVHDALAALPTGYETPLTRIFLSHTEAEEGGTAGVVLSGGQWQRVALARAMLRGDRDLLILDEPSAGLDPEAEHEIHARLCAHRRDRTSLLISHRLGAVRDADAIAVLDGGRVAEHGGHDELVAAGGIYARLFSLQAAGYHDPEGVGLAR